MNTKGTHGYSQVPNNLQQALHRKRLILIVFVALTLLDPKELM